MVNKQTHYTVLARRFRPQAFDQVVGQDHVARALRNAIRQDRVAHAYLFTGARGVGKTSTARILAKALNCPNATDGVPCNDCEICDGISAGNDVDVLEIDGASNRGIDDIRSLRANVGVRSMRTRYKLYIIDEVHMLTREAFNALLKTLEEPPPSVKFVFCTTEPNKVPDTILSRCQRFDFSAIGEESIAGRLREIAQAEGYEVTDDAIELVARRARGSMRDSQSLFDQLLAFSEGTVEAADVHRMLGTASDDLLVQLFDAVAAHRPGDVLGCIDEAVNSGVQLSELLDQCIAYTRDLLVVSATDGATSLCGVSGSHAESLKAQATGMGSPNVMAAFQILAEARTRLQRSTFGRVLVEMSLTQVALLENLSAVSELLSGRLPDMPEAAASAEKKNTELTPGEVVVSGETSDDTAAASANAAATIAAGTSDSAGASAGSGESHCETPVRPAVESESADSAAGQLGSPPVADAEGRLQQSVLSSAGADSQSSSGDTAEETAGHVSRTAAERDDIRAGDFVEEVSVRESTDSETQVAVDQRSEGAVRPGNVVSADAAQTVPQSESPVSPFSPDNADRMLQQLRSIEGFTLSQALRAVAAVRLAEPNQVELLLPESKQPRRRLLEQPESRATIESVIRTFTGVQPAVSVRLIADHQAGEPAAAEHPATEENNGVTEDSGSRPEETVGGSVVAAAGVSENDPIATRKGQSSNAVREQAAVRHSHNLLKSVDPEQDPFLQQIVEAFDATLSRITERPRHTLQNSADSPSGMEESESNG